MGLQNNVVVRAPFAANHQISFGIKDAGGWESCRAVQLALAAGVETNTIEVRGHSLKVSIELSPRKRATLRNMFRAESFLKKTGSNSESYILCHKSSKIFSRTNEELGETPKATMLGCGIVRIVPLVACCWQVGKNLKIDYLMTLLTSAYEERNVSSAWCLATCKGSPEACARLCNTFRSFVSGMQFC